MTCCGGKPSHAIKLIEAAAGQPVAKAVIHRAMRQPATFDQRLAWYIHLASERQCSIEELTELSLVRSAFEWSNPDLRARALELSIGAESRRLVATQNVRTRADAEIERLTARLADLHAELRDLIPKPAAPRKRPAGRAVKRRPAAA